MKKNEIPTYNDLCAELACDPAAFGQCCPMGPEGPIYATADGDRFYVLTSDGVWCVTEMHTRRVDPRRLPWSIATAFGYDGELDD